MLWMVQVPWTNNFIKWVTTSIVVVLRAETILQNGKQILYYTVVTTGQLHNIITHKVGEWEGGRKEGMCNGKI